MTKTSSAMKHKKNPTAAERRRARRQRLSGQTGGTAKFDIKIEVRISGTMPGGQTGRADVGDLLSSAVMSAMARSRKE